MQKQLVIPITSNGVTTQTTQFFNAASVTVKGVETEIQTQLARGLSVRGVMGYQDGKYNQYVTPIPAGYDLASAPIDRAPRWTWSLDAAYSHGVGSWGDVTLDANANYVAKNLFSQSITTASSNAYLDARTLFNASIDLSDASDRYYIKLIGRNLTDERYLTANQVVATLFSYGMYGPPRSIDLEMGLKWGSK